jgi:hypothetical protein
MLNYVRVAISNDVVRRYNTMRCSVSARRAGSNECGPGHAASLSRITDNLQHRSSPGARLQTEQPPS